MKSIFVPNYKGDINNSTYDILFKNIFKSKIDEVLILNEGLINIHYGNITLSLWQEKDIEELYNIANNDNISKNFIGFPSPYTLDDAKNWVLSNLKLNNNNISFSVKYNNKVVGLVNCEINETNKEGILSYWIGEEYQGKGIGSSSLDIFIKYLFNNTNIESLNAFVFEENLISKKILLSKGFKIDGDIKNVTNNDGIVKNEYNLILEKDFYLKLQYIKENIKQIKNLFDNYNDFILDYLGLKTGNGEFILKLKTGEELTLRIRNKEVSDIDIVAEIFINKDYDIENIVTDNMTVIDIGGQVGIFSFYLSRYLNNGKIYSFEPLDENFSILKKNATNSSCIIPINKAIGAKSGKGKLFISKENAGGHSMIESENKETKNINIISLQDVVSNFGINSIDLLKVDCEGAEYEIFYSLSDNFLNKIKHIYMEVHYTEELSKKHNKYDMFNFLKNKGFEVKILEEFSYEGEGDFYIVYAKNKNSLTF